MSDGRDVIFLYDGSFYGLLTVIFDVYLTRVFPAGIETDENVQETIFCDYEYTETDCEKARRVETSILKRISARALHNVYYAYLSNVKDKELSIFNYIRAGYRYGWTVDNYLALDCVNEVLTAARNVGNEAHLFKEFVRFTELKNGVYYAKIEPKNNVLPAIEEHFSDRYSSMPFIIHDAVRRECLACVGGQSVIRSVDSLTALELSENETAYRELWQCFFDTVEIRERHNEKCQNTHLPKRFRKNMTEFGGAPNKKTGQSPAVIEI